ncbi:hypothetical protein AAH991_37160 [Microbispora sp. ZYX-F-249]|uniref:Uncharacterized protein n=1 Tax=Microbispora maris TaxID=3144104 RepID=A0ABV0B157_9ACTN
MFDDPSRAHSDWTVVGIAVGTVLMTILAGLLDNRRQAGGMILGAVWRVMPTVVAAREEGQVLLPGNWFALASVAAMTALALVLLAGKDKDHPRSAPSPIQNVSATVGGTAVAVQRRQKVVRSSHHLKEPPLGLTSGPWHSITERMRPKKTESLTHRRPGPAWMLMVLPYVVSYSAPTKSLSASRSQTMMSLRSALISTEPLPLMSRAFHDSTPAEAPDAPARSEAATSAARTTIRRPTISLIPFLD